MPNGCVEAGPGAGSDQPAPADRRHAEVTRPAPFDCVAEDFDRFVDHDTGPGRLQLEVEDQR